MDKRQTVWKSSLVVTVPPSLLCAYLYQDSAHGKPSVSNSLSIAHIGNKHKLKIPCLTGARSTLAPGFFMVWQVCVQHEIFWGWNLSLTAHALSPAWGWFWAAWLHSCIPTAVITDLRSQHCGALGIFTLGMLNLDKCEPYKQRDAGAGLLLHGGSPAYVYAGPVQQTAWEIEKLEANDKSKFLLDYLTHRKLNIQLKIFNDKTVIHSVSTISETSIPTPGIPPMTSQQHSHLQPLSLYQGLKASDGPASWFQDDLGQRSHLQCGVSSFCPMNQHWRTFPERKTQSTDGKLLNNEHFLYHE